MGIPSAIYIYIFFWNLRFAASKNCKYEKVYVLRSNICKTDVLQIITKSWKYNAKFGEVVDWKAVLFIEKKHSRTLEISLKKPRDSFFSKATKARAEVASYSVPQKDCTSKHAENLQENKHPRKRVKLRSSRLEVVYEKKCS